MKKIITQIVKFFIYIACYIVYPFSFLIPRTKEIYAYGSYRGAFNDNSKYLFIYANQHVKNKRHVWLTTSQKTVQHVRSLGFEAYWLGSPVGMWLALRSKYWFVNSYTSDILFFLSGGATVINLWHGVPMKCIEFTITKGELAKRYVRKEIRDVFFHPASFRRPDYMVSTTDFFDDIFSRSFRIQKNQCLQVGCPRNNMLQLPKEEVEQFVNQYESVETQQLIAKIKHYDRTYVYMPTWRDSQADIFANGFDLEELNRTLKEKNYLAIMKPHVNTRIDTGKQYTNLIFLDGGVDMYCILPFSDILITDYSSVLYDYLLMPNKGILLFHYDYDEYVQEREFLFPIDEEITGKRVYSFAELLEAIVKSDDAVNASERKRIIEMFWGDTIHKNACEEILKFINSLNECKKKDI